MREWGVQLRSASPRAFSENEVKKIIYLYVQENLSIEKCIDVLGKGSQSSVTKVLVENNIDLRSNGEYAHLRFFEGATFGGLTLLKRVGNEKQRYKWRAKCSCGKIIEINAYKLTCNEAIKECDECRLKSRGGDLLSCSPEIASQAYGWDPSVVPRASRAIRDWKCAKETLDNSSLPRDNGAVIAGQD